MNIRLVTSYSSSFPNKQYLIYKDLSGYSYISVSYSKIHNNRFPKS